MTRHKFLIMSKFFWISRAFLSFKLSYSNVHETVHKPVRINTRTPVCMYIYPYICKLAPFAVHIPVQIYTRTSRCTYTRTNVNPYTVPYSVHIIYKYIPVHYGCTYTCTWCCRFDWTPCDGNPVFIFSSLSFNNLK